MLGVGRDDVVARLEEALEGEIERLSAAGGENDSASVMVAEELRDAEPGLCGGASDLNGGSVAASAKRSADCLLVAIDRHVNSVRLGKAGGGVIEVDAGHRRHYSTIAATLPVPPARRQTDG